MQYRYLYFIPLLMWLASWPCGLSAQQTEQQKAALDKEYQKAYEETTALYPKTDAKAYEAAARKLMAVCLKVGNDEMFYKAWSNLASYTLRTNTEKALKVANEMNDYAKKHNSKYGYFVATYLNSYIAGRMGKMDMAEKTGEEAINYKRRYLPNVNGAFAYWNLADLYILKKKKQEALRLLDQIEDEPDLKPSHHTYAWTYKCKAVYEIPPVDTAQFLAYYAEFKKAVEKYKHYADPEMMNDYRYAAITGDHQKMLEIARKRPSDLLRYSCLSETYERMGRWKEALDTLKAYYHLHDSIADEEALQKAERISLELSAARASSEAQMLRYEKDRMMFIWILVAATALFIFFSVFLWLRHRQARRMGEMRASQERLLSELSIARDIQMSMVPSRFPDRKGLDMCASMKPAKEVGGDLYGYMEQGDKLYLAIGDVSGKGVPASLVMSQTTRLFQMLAKQGNMPVDICNQINDALSGQDNESGMFVTLWVGLLNLKTGHLDFCNAGHNSPVIGGGETGGEFLNMEPNAPLGLWPELEYIGEEIDTVKGRTVFLYTDGLTEAENPALEQLGDERLLDILRHKKFHSCRELIDSMTAEVEKHRDGAEPNDDLTMMCINLR